MSATTIINLSDRRDLGSGQRLNAAAVAKTCSSDAVGKRLKLLRSILADTQVEFAAAMNIRPNAWNNYELGRSRIGIDAAARVCAVHGVTMDFIFLGDVSGLPYSLQDTIRNMQRLRKSRA